MRLSGNIAKKRRDEKEPVEEDRELETFFDETHFVEFDKHGSGQFWSG